MVRTSVFWMSPPSPGWTLRGRANFRSVSAPPVDPVRALSEWLGLADAIEARGGRVLSLLPQDDSLTGLPYAAECGHLFAPPGQAPVFVLPSMKPEHRRGEVDRWEEALAAMGIPARRVTAGFWEGQGDVAEFGGQTLFLYGGRTTRAGAEEAATLAGSRVVAPLFIEIGEPAFHGNMAMLPLTQVDRLLVCRDVLVGEAWDRLVSAFGAERLVEVSVDEIRAYATNGLPIGRDVLAPSLTPSRVVSLLRSLGVEPVLLPMDELCGKAGGASRCLVSCGALDAQELRVPPDLDYRLQGDTLRARLR